jgi:hypothetical protein
MKRIWELLLVLVALAFVTAAWLWESQALGGGRLTAADVEQYIAAIEANLDAPEDQKRALLANVRAWASEDDGRPVYMLNLMRYNERVLPYARIDPAHAATPEASNRYYEQQVTPIALGGGAYPIFAGNVSGDNLAAAQASVRWSRVLVMRYPNRRAFLEFVSDPAYGRVAAYKLMALELVLVPTAAEIAPPSAALIAASLALMALLAFAWLRPRHGARNTRKASS